MRNFDPLTMLIMGAAMRNYRMQYPETPFRIDGCDGKSWYWNKVKRCYYKV